MKFIVENMVRFVITVIAATLVLTAIGGLLIPVLTNYLPVAFSGEKYYTDASGGAGPTITCLSEVPVSLNGSVDLFDASVITVRSGTGENLISQLTSDYAKNVADRDHVFIYRINKDNSTTLCSQIDTSVPGNWTVVYLVTDDNGSATSTVTYKVR